jgi:diguanylate cyclase (GGDEF)-like protein
VISSVCKKLFPGDSGCLGIMDQFRTRLNIVDFWGNPPTKSLKAGIENYYDPLTISGDMLGILSLCFRAHKSDNSDSKLPANIEAKRKILTKVTELYALSLVNLRLRETLRMESIRDPLTGLYNRRYMEESLEREAYRAKRHNTSIGIIILDVDYFKSFNDTYGHEGGDLVLQELGTFLQKHIRGEDIACRYGGDEFLLILPEVPLEIVVQRAKELHLAAKKLSITHQGRSLHITISAGVAMLFNHNGDVKEAVKAADTALYQAKNKGRDQVVVASSGQF